MLSQSGYTPALFKQSLTEDMVISQVRTGLAGSDFATPTELEITARVSGEQRDLRYLTVPLERFRQNEAISDVEIETYYDETQNEFLSPETVVLDYIELLAEDFYQPVDEAALLEAYEIEKESYAYATENRVSHILFEEREDETSEERLARIDAARAELDAGADFAAVAGKYSDDVGSAAAGGDLGFSAGDAFPEEMEEAIAALEVGAISAPVETDAGVHLIQLTERRDGEPPTFEEVRPQLETRLKEEEARVVLLRTVEALRDISFNAEDLQAPAEELQLSVERSEPISRSQSEGLFANPSLLEAAFSAEVLENGHNSDVIELAGNHFVVLRLRSHQRPEVRPLAEVSDAIAATIRESRAREAVKAEAEKLVRALRDGADIGELASVGDFDWQVELGADRRNTNVPPVILNRAFQLSPPPEGEKRVDYVQAPGGDALVLELTRVSPGRLADMEQQEQAVLGQQVRAEFGTLVDNEYRSGLRADADISVM
jgi:peptidyl-prolyl cis-trans isomerase D